MRKDEGDSRGGILAREKAIAIFSDSYSPRLDGIAFSAERLAAAFDEIGWRVKVFAPRAGKAIAKGSRDIDIERFQAIRSPADGYPLALPLVFDFRKSLQDFSPDLVSIQTVGPLGISGLVSALELGLEVALSWHTDFESYAAEYPISWPYILASASRLASTRQLLPRRGAPNKGVLARALSTLGGSASFVVAPSVRTAKHIQELGVRRPIFILPTGVSASDISGGKIPLHLARAIDHLPQGKRFVYFGRLSREKGLPTLLDTFGRVRCTDQNASLTLVGPCNDRKTRRLLKRAKRKFGDMLVVHGAIGRDSAQDLFSKMDAFVTASMTETQGISIWEASLAGLPIAVLDPSLCVGVPSCWVCRSSESETFSESWVKASSKKSSVLDTSLGPNLRQQAKLVVDALGIVQLKTLDGDSLLFEAPRGEVWQELS
ncbi:glycosyltransferase [Nocardia aurea]|uniref:Glycosyltransferase n=1 Tax=Nocardia aurea TaxID=2144174 RepID=A0ABV3FPM6_9NOCA